MIGDIFLDFGQFSRLTVKSRIGFNWFFTLYCVRLGYSSLLKVTSKLVDHWNFK